MEIRNPDYLVEIARQRGISRAAEQLFVTQSTLSQYLLKLEAEVGTPLFLRDQGKLTLTDAGRICVAAAEDILRIERTAEASVAALQSRGQIDLGVTSAWGMALVADLLPEFRRAYPYVTLRITENRSYRQIKAALRAGRVDLAVMAVTPDDDVPAQGYVHLRQEEIVLVLPADHPFCREQAGDTVPRSVLSGALREVPFLLSCRDSSIRPIGVPAPWGLRAQQQRHRIADGCRWRRRGADSPGLCPDRRGRPEFSSGRAPGASGRAGLPKRSGTDRRAGIFGAANCVRRPVPFR